MSSAGSCAPAARAASSCSPLPPPPNPSRPAPRPPSPRSKNYLYFGRHVLDRACKDKKGVFSPSFALEMLLERVGGAGGDAAAAAAGDA